MRRLALQLMGNVHWIHDPILCLKNKDKGVALPLESEDILWIFFEGGDQYCERVVHLDTGQFKAVVWTVESPGLSG